jgi:hypothetical protein
LIFIVEEIRIATRVIESDQVSVITKRNDPHPLPFDTGPITGSSLEKSGGRERSTSFQALNYRLRLEFLGPVDPEIP